MKRVQIVVAFLVGCGAVCSVQPAEAQGGYYPTFSPWLQLGRDDPGPLGPYYTHVRPRQELRRVLAGQAAQIQHGQARIETLQGQITRLQLGQTGQIRATGTGSTFMNYSHYYPGFGGGRGGGGRAAPSRMPTRSLTPSAIGPITPY